MAKSAHKWVKCNLLLDVGWQTILQMHETEEDEEDDSEKYSTLSAFVFDSFCFVCQPNEKRAFAVDILLVCERSMIQKRNAIEAQSVNQWLAASVLMLLNDSERFQYRAAM